MTAASPPAGDRALVGIIANPVAGTDIRRVTGHAPSSTRLDKVGVLRRLLVGLDSSGIGRVAALDEGYGLVRAAAEGLDLRFELSMLDIEPTGTPVDTERAAARLVRMGATCLVTLGGDGTNRWVARACGDVPLLPLSTGTNNVFPVLLEATTAGLAAGAVARGLVPLEQVVVRRPRLEIYRDGRWTDLALVDACVYADRFIGARVLLDAERIEEVYLAAWTPGSVGLAALGSMLDEAPAGMHGLWLRLAPARRGPTVRFPLAPGLVRSLSVTEWGRFLPGELRNLPRQAFVLALDGERERLAAADEGYAIAFNPRGPLVVRTGRVLSLAFRAGFLRDA